jgi:hypothetical protein
MPSLFDSRVRTDILARISRLAPERKPIWGRFTAPEMVCHVSSDLRQALGELDARPPSGPLSRFPMNWLVIHVFPWPKGRGRSPREFLATPPATWAADVAQLRDLVERVSARGAHAAWPPSPVFGRISGASRGVMAYRHLDHHLRQFGV